jgi:hypothetical protein
MEREGRGPTKAAFADRLIRKLRRIRARIAAASRAGQVVSGRKSAALGLFDLLAARWRRCGAMPG